MTVQPDQSQCKKMTGNPQKTKVSLYFTDCTVRKATVLCPLELERLGGGGQLVRQAFGIPLRAQRVGRDTERLLSR